MSANWQEWLVFALVGISVLSLSRGFFRTWLAAPIAQFLLKRGKVSVAMKLKKQADGVGCGGCGASGGSCASDSPRSASPLEFQRK